MLYYALMFLVVGVMPGFCIFGRSGRDRGPNFLGSVLDRDRVGRGPCDHGAHRSGCVTGGCRLSDSFPA